jgi:hypothetical protein
MTSPVLPMISFARQSCHAARMRQAIRGAVGMPTEAVMSTMCATIQAAYRSGLLLFHCADLSLADNGGAGQ